MGDPLAKALAHLPSHSRGSNLQAYWEVGERVSVELPLPGDIGTARLAKLAAKQGVSEAKLRQCERFYRTWKPQRVEAAEKAGLAWRAVVGMLTYSDRAWLLRNHAPYAERQRLAAQADAIDRMLDALIADVGKGKVERTTIKTRLKAWKQKHPNAFADRISRPRGSMDGAIDL